LRARKIDVDNALRDAVFEGRLTARAGAYYTVADGVCSAERLDTEKDRAEWVLNNVRHGVARTAAKSVLKALASEDSGRRGRQSTARPTGRGTDNRAGSVAAKSSTLTRPAKGKLKRKKKGEKGNLKRKGKGKAKAQSVGPGRQATAAAAAAAAPAENDAEVDRSVACTKCG
jgi:hypothetical protein